MRRKARQATKAENRPRFWGRHAVAAALANPDRIVHRLWATREAAAGLDLGPAIPVTFADVADLGRMVPRDAPHQGWSPRSSGSTTSCSPICSRAPGTAGLWSCSTRSPIRTMSARSCARRPPSARSASSPRTATPRPNRALSPRRRAARSRPCPWVRVVNLARALEEIAEAGFWRIGLAGRSRSDARRGARPGPGRARPRRRGRGPAPEQRRPLRLAGAAADQRHREPQRLQRRRDRALRRKRR